MKIPVLLLLSMLSFVAAAQTVDGISAPVSRTVALAADEATFTISVAGTLDSTAQQIKQALQNAGLPNPTVVAIGLGQDSSRVFSAPVQMVYSATAAIPAGAANDTIKSIEDLRTHLAVPLISLQYQVRFNPSQAAVDAMRQTLLPQLIDDSRKLAQSLASAAGVKLGAIRSIGDAGIGGVFLLGVPTSAERIGDFSGLVTGVLSPVILPAPPYNPQYTFSLNVIFAVR